MLIRLLGFLAFFSCMFFLTATSGIFGCAGQSDDSITESFFPETCAEIQEAAIDDTGEQPDDGTYTLYINGDESQPWDAYCYGMNRSEPLEFLTVSEADNYSQIGNGEVIIETTYHRIRIDPIQLELHSFDDTFASTDESEAFTPVFPIEGMEHIPLGWAEFQPESFNDDAGVESKVDLTDTPFILNTDIEDMADEFFCNVTNPSYDEHSGDGSGYEISADLTSFTLTARNINSMQFEGASTREVADCEHLGPDTDFNSDTWENDDIVIPLEYVGE